MFLQLQTRIFYSQTFGSLEFFELGHPGSQALLHLVHGEAILGVNRVQKGVVLLIVVVGLSPFTIRGSIGYDGRLKGAILLEV